MLRHTVVVMMFFVIGGELCIIKKESAPLESLGQGAYKEMSGQSPYPTEPDLVPMEDIYGEQRIRSTEAFVDRLERGIRVWAQQNINGMNIETLLAFPPEFEDDEEGGEEEEDPETAKWNAMRLKLENLKLSAHILGVASNENHKKPESYKYFFVILKYGHLKIIQPSTGDEVSAKIAAEAYIGDHQFETIIQDPIWKTNGNALLENSPPVFAMPERHWGADYEVLSCWKLSFEPGVDRYITMLKHKIEHAHWFFVSALMFEDMHKPTQINYVGGYVNSPFMAEISVLNFMNLSREFKNGIWSDSSSQPGTWSCGYTGISWKAESPRNAIYASINKIVASVPIDVTGVDISYFFAIGTRHMPCPISPEEYSLYLFHSIDYYWITVQVPDGKGGHHLISIVHRYLDNIYYDTILEEYSGYYPVETTISVSESADIDSEISKDVIEPSKALKRKSGQSEKRKSTTVLANLLHPSRILNRTKSQSEKKTLTTPVPNFNRSKSGRDVSKIIPPQ